MENEQVPAVNNDEAAAEAPDAPKKATRTRRKAAPKAETAAGAEVTAADAGTQAGADASVPEAAAPVRRTRARKKVDAVAEPLPAFAADDTAGDAGAKDSTGPTEPAATVNAPAGAETPAEAEPETKPVRRRRVATRKTSAPDVAAAGPEALPEAAAAVETAPETPAPEAATPDAPAEETQAPAVAETSVPDAAAVTESAKTAEPAPAEAAPASPFGSLFLEPGSATSVLFQAPDLSTVVRPAPALAAAADEPEEDDAELGEEDDANGRRRRRSRGRRGRSRTGDRELDGDSEGADNETDDADEESAGTADEGVTSRRRRRRRRGDQDLELTGGGDDDPPNTVTRVRAPRAVTEAPVNNRVTSVKGSTRLEAKKQRRRESRDTGRRRTVITEAEFLARRESVDRQMIVRQRDDRIQIGVLEDGVLAEHFVSKTDRKSVV